MEVYTVREYSSLLFVSAYGIGYKIQWLLLFDYHLSPSFLAALQVYDQEGHLNSRMLIPTSAARLLGPWTHLHIFAFLIAHHDFDDQVLGMRGDRLLTDVLDKLAELHRQALLALDRAGISDTIINRDGCVLPSSCR